MAGCIWSGSFWCNDHDLGPYEFLSSNHRGGMCCPEQHMRLSRKSTSCLSVAGNAAGQLNLWLLGKCARPGLIWHSELLQQSVECSGEWENCPKFLCASLLFFVACGTRNMVVWSVLFGPCGVLSTINVYLKTWKFKAGPPWGYFSHLWT